MNDPVIERVACEDPVEHGALPERLTSADAALQQVLAAIDANHGGLLRRSRSESPTFVNGLSRRPLAGRRRLPGGVGFVATVLVVATVVVVALVALGHRRVTIGPATQTHPTSPSSDAAVRAVPAGSVAVGGGPASLLVSGGSLWVAGGRLLHFRIDR